MSDTGIKCPEHSGFSARIVNLETSQVDQWNAMEKHNARLDQIFTRLNVMLGGIVVACVLLVINLLLKR